MSSILAFLNPLNAEPNHKPPPRPVRQYKTVFQFHAGDLRTVIYKRKTRAEGNYVANLLAEFDDTDSCEVTLVKTPDCEITRVVN